MTFLSFFLSSFLFLVPAFCGEGKESVCLVSLVGKCRQAGCRVPSPEEARLARLARMYISHPARQGLGVFLGSGGPRWPSGWVGISTGDFKTVHTSYFIHRIWLLKSGWRLWRRTISSRVYIHRYEYNNPMEFIFSNSLPHRSSKRASRLPTSHDLMHF